MKEKCRKRREGQVQDETLETTRHGIQNCSCNLASFFVKSLVQNKKTLFKPSPVIKISCFVGGGKKIE